MLQHTSHKFRPSSAILIVGFLPSLHICGSDEIMSSGALHQITTGRVCNNNVDRSLPHRSIRNHNINTPSAPPREPMKEGSQCAPDARVCVRVRVSCIICSSVTPMWQSATCYIWKLECPLILRTYATNRCERSFPPTTNLRVVSTCLSHCSSG